MDIETALVLGLIYIVPVLVPWVTCALVARFVVGRKDAFHPWEFVALPLPGIVWLTLFANDPFGTVSSKSLSNGIAEPMWTGIAYGALSVWKLLGAVKWPMYNKMFSVAMPVVASLIAVVVFFGTPSLPE